MSNYAKQDGFVAIGACSSTNLLSSHSEPVRLVPRPPLLPPPPAAYIHNARPPARVLSGVNAIPIGKRPLLSNSSSDVVVEPVTKQPRSTREQEEYKWDNRMPPGCSTPVQHTVSPSDDSSESAVSRRRIRCPPGVVVEDFTPENGFHEPPSPPTSDSSDTGRSRTPSPDPLRHGRKVHIRPGVWYYVKNASEFFHFFNRFLYQSLWCVWNKGIMRGWPRHVIPMRVVENYVELHDFGCPYPEAPYHRRKWIDFNHIEAVRIQWEDVDRFRGVNDASNLFKPHMDITLAPRTTDGKPQVEVPAGRTFNPLRVSLHRPTYELPKWRYTEVPRRCVYHALPCTPLGDC